MAEMMKGEMVPLSRLRKAPWNYKTNNHTLTAKLARNIERNGQVENLVVRNLPDGSLEIVNGNHRFDALEALGKEYAWVLNLGDITEIQAKRVAIELNETHFANDETVLAHRLRELMKDFSLEDLTATLPYDEAELKATMDTLSLDWTSFPEVHTRLETAKPTVRIACSLEMAEKIMEMADREVDSHHDRYAELIPVEVIKASGTQMKYIMKAVHHLMETGKAETPAEALTYACSKILSPGVINE